MPKHSTDGRTPCWCRPWWARGADGTIYVVHNDVAGCALNLSPIWLSPGRFTVWSREGSDT